MKLLGNFLLIYYCFLSNKASVLYITSKLCSSLVEVLYKNDENNSNDQSIKKLYVSKFNKIRDTRTEKTQDFRKTFKVCFETYSTAKYMMPKKKWFFL